MTRLKFGFCILIFARLLNRIFNFFFFLKKIKKLFLAHNCVLLFLNFAVSFKPVSLI